MIITGITPEDFRSAVAKISMAHYSENLRVEIGTQMSPTRFRARVIVAESGAAMWPKTELSAPGARRSHSGRRLKAACWHAYRDAIQGVFDVNPNARVYTGMSKYVGLDGFLENYPATAHQNIGSTVQPAYMPDLCDCDHYGIPTHEQG